MLLLLVKFAVEFQKTAEDQAIEFVELLGDLALLGELVPGAGACRSRLNNNTEFFQPIQVIVYCTPGNASLSSEFGDIQIAITLINEDTQKFRPRWRSE